ncbi:MAG: hypothetical protein WBO23_11045 [Burkholderiales bacterium]
MAEMKPTRIRYPLIFFAAMFLANGAVAAARACIVGPAAQEHTAIQVLATGGDEDLCPEADSAAKCLAHFTQIYDIYDSELQNLSSNAPAVAVAPFLLHRVWFPVGARRLVIASAPPVVGPPLTILFRNFRI